ncbi:MAG: DNA mismatch repair endonuclease MutL [Chloroflexota bacterium]|nr:DNA mismatch repair endonuclease MutL [Chloroflexota bacterium]
MTIHILDEQVVAQIAAGEVVERPSSVVKELIENAIDAGATTISASIDGDGGKRIQIIDNGTGIASAEVELAFARHATSKLQSPDDLYNIRTLGFRGEALASIASVSHLTIQTRRADEEAGTLIRIEGGKLLTRRGVGIPTGTTLTVENLFFNTPARLKFMKKETTEKRQIASVISRYAMAYPQVRFLLEQDGRELFRTTGNGELIDVIFVALGLDQIRHMLPVDDQADDIRVTGYTSAPDLNRADRTRITLFVNGRWITDNALMHAVVQAYHTLLMSGRYPVSVLMIDMPPSDVDVNVHPTKAEVRFRDQDRIFSALQRAVRRAVIDQAQTPTLRMGRTFRGGSSWERDRSFGGQINMPIVLEDTGQFPQHRQTNDAANGVYPNDTPPTDPTAIPHGMGAPQKPRTLPILRVVGQVASTYIIAEGPAGMYLIDQHAAHERILYEQFMEEHAKQGRMAQYMLAAQTVQVAPDEERLIEQHSALLDALGMGLEAFGPGVFIVRSVPAMLADTDVVELLGALLDDLEQGKKPGQESMEAIIVRRICKQASIKGGQILTFEQMQELIRQLERCQSPMTCPHGRPTMIHMSSDQLAREFGRLGAG